MVIALDLIPGYRLSTLIPAQLPSGTNGKVCFPIAGRGKGIAGMSIAVPKRGRQERSARDGQRFRRAGDDGGRRRGRLHDISLDDKYLLDEGRVLLTGLQGLVRLPLDQHRADRRRGLHTGTMISGYQGSPLGGLDKELARNRELVEG